MRQARPDEAPQFYLRRFLNSLPHDQAGDKMQNAILGLDKEK
ncbi:hypothetical protein RZS08_16805 [Arthrospira platensis SPKY1]|nr:hypothetical protein [Arthrospira platensis SPKY1]